MQHCGTPLESCSSSAPHDATEAYQRYHSRSLMRVLPKVLLLVHLCIVPIAHASGSFLEIFVSPSGRPGAKGNREDPVDSPLLAQAMAREAQGSTTVRRVNIYLQGGTHYLPDTLVLNASDSGTVWKGPGTVSGGSLLSNPVPAPAPYPAGTLEYSVPAGIEVTQLFCDGFRMQRARTVPSDPSEAYQRFLGPNSTARWAKPLQPCASADSNGIERGAGSAVNSAGCPPADRTGMVVEPSALQFLHSGLYDLANVSVLVFNAWTADWARVQSVDESTGTVQFRDQTLGAVGQYAVQGGQRFLVDNAREGLDEPGEWYWDAAAGRNKLYFLPPPGFDPGSSRVVVPRLRTVVSIEAGATDISMQGIAVQHSTDGGMDARARTYIPSRGALEVADASGIALEGVQVQHAGQACVVLHSNVTSVGVLRSMLSDCGGDGLLMNEQNSDIRVADSVVNDTGRIFLSQPAGVRMRGQRNITVEHCDVGHSSYGGILVGWQHGWPTPSGRGKGKGSLNARGPARQPPVMPVEPVFRVRYNAVHDFGLGILSDFGGIYISSNNNTCFRPVPNDCSVPTEVYQNLVSMGRHFNYGSEGVYTDEQASDVNVTGNIFHDIGDSGVYFHCGANHWAENNVVAFTARQPSGTSLKSCNAGGNPTWPNLPHGFDFRRNVVLASQGPVTADRDYRNTSFDDNVYWTSPAGDEALLRFPNGTTFGQWQAQGQDSHSAVQDPLFVDAQGRNFTLREGSPALQRGFRQFDYEAVGPRPSASSK